MRWLKRFWERGRKGYCYEDLWSFEYWLSNLIASGLREFKANCHGYPTDIDDWETWMAILDEMIECFTDQTRSIDNLLGTPDQPVNSEGYHEAFRKKKERLHRGFELLEKYYYALWD